MEFVIPGPLKREHEELHEQLRKANQGRRRGWRSGKSVRQTHASSLREGRRIRAAAPRPVALLAKGSVTPDMTAVLKLTDTLKQELGEMLAEHKTIVEALQVLADAARRENKPEYVTFAEKLILHAQTEEEVMYPAALLIGEYLKLKLNGR